MDQEGLQDSQRRGTIPDRSVDNGTCLARVATPDNAPLPERAVCWGLNYRGELDFLGQARAQADSKNLHVENGWRYFPHGWSEHITEVLGSANEAEVFERVREVTES